MDNIAPYFMFILLSVSCFYSKFVSSTANLTPTKFLRDPQTLVSNNNLFKFGFFSPINSTNRYVGIWYNIGDSTTQEIVWIANRNNPIKNKSSGFLKISENGNLQLISDKNKTLIWSTNVTHQGNSSSSIVAKLLDSGNLVLESTLNQKIIWQSFEHLTDSLLSESRVTLNLTIDDGMRETPILRSWSSPSDPSMGRFRIGLIPFPITEFVVRDHDNIHWRSGPWNGTQFIGVPYGSAEVFSIVYHKHEFILDMFYYVPNNSFLDHYVLGYDGNVVLKYWNNVTKKWDIGWESIESKCDIFGQCGAFGLCNAQDSPICSCLNGFEPKNLDEWKKGNWSGGCVRRTSLKCGKTGIKADGFLMLPHVKLPDDISFVKGEDGDGCRKECLEVCSCKAYAYVEGIGCMIWNDMIVDIQVFAADGVDLFLRLAHSELDEATNMKPIIAAIAATAATTFFVVLAYFLWNFMYRGHAHKKLKNEAAEDGEVDQPEFKDLSMFKFNDLEAATNNFSEMNKLGRGGFGLVYKGKLENGQEIAVKRLSRTSGQGLQEFMNEVLVISKLQHKNLVKLLGCCVVREEKLLVYEYMPNKSLDAFLFDSHHRIHLDWKKRFNIISGICRGLLYLHRDSRLKIIHRDLKASNILLDEEFNPKISDFGMARIFETKQDQANTLRVVGTYGYMSPEYAMEGRFSEKSDVFSLGVLMLEMVSGRKNSSNFLNYEALSLPTYAWKLWQENDVVSLIDPTIVDPCYKDEILKLIQLGLLCVQEYPRDRPTISTLVSMFEVDMNDLPQPTKPGFTQWNATSSDEHLQTGQEHGSINNVSLTTISGR